ncbi:4'-phosphopantetheinyl transferase family protein [Sphaerotilus sulfidivorans]|uniref:4'-phosphopantetheinyl transferase family protein n=1 Tax=Sphaerotilus sp. FB-3 TaxID=2913396 RepID=UPI00203C9925|nr:4'-phosphopantetheinyl transferase superfamily protein [Sphaerotilus sp. FB-3]GKQ59764.1 hypothetical protein QMTAC487_36250 [Sphaerotilus sp. FB-3]
MFGLRRHRPCRIELHLMPVAPGEPEDPVDLAVLDEFERARAMRLRRPADRVLFIRAHALLRRVLSRHAPIDPARWRLVRAEAGKPALCPQQHPALQALRFNLSHCAGLVALAWEREIGVDVEPVDALQPDEALARTLLAPGEWRHWPTLVDAHGVDGVDGMDGGGGGRARRHFLLTRWTLKEALLKAAGIGLSGLEPAGLELLPAPNGLWRVQPGRAALPATLRHWVDGGWLQGGLEAGSHHWALACERQAGETIELQWLRHSSAGVIAPG